MAGSGCGGVPLLSRTCLATIPAALCCVFLLAVLMPSPVRGQEWNTYINPRFGTVADVPATGFRADPPPANGDGQSWTSADGLGKMSVYGSFMAVADSVAGYRQFTLASARESGVRITYSTSRDNWFVYSGVQDGSIVYAKVVVTRPCGTNVANHIYLQYPASQSSIYDPVVKRMSASLRGGSGVSCP